MIVTAHKNPDEISNETFLTWVSRTLKEVEKDTIINGWNPLLNGIKEEEELNLSNIADIGETETREDDIDLMNELIGDQEEKHGLIEEMLNYEVVNYARIDSINMRIKL